MVNGGEKVVITVERPAENRAMVYSRASPPSVDVKSIPSGKSVRPRPFQMKVVRGALGEDVVRVFIPQVRQNIPLWTVLRALGARNDRQIHREMLVGLPPGPVYVYADQVLRSSMLDSSMTSEEEAVEFISRHVSSFGGGTDTSMNLAGALQHAHSRTRDATDDASVELAAQERARVERRKRLVYAKTILRREVLPHVGDSRLKKRLYIGSLLRRLMFALATNAPNDDATRLSTSA